MPKDFAIYAWRSAPAGTIPLLHFMRDRGRSSNGAKVMCFAVLPHSTVFSEPRGLVQDSWPMSGRARAQVFSAVISRFLGRAGSPLPGPERPRNREITAENTFDSIVASPADIKHGAGRGCMMSGLLTQRRKYWCLQYLRRLMSTPGGRTAGGKAPRGGGLKCPKHLAPCSSDAENVVLLTFDE